MTHKTLASSAEISARIDALAADIIRYFPGDKPVFVALLRGAAPFAGMLMFAIAHQAPDFQPELDYMMVSTYGDGRQAGEPHIVTDLAPDTHVAGRTVVILDDVLDKGVTANFVSSHMQSRGATEIKLAVLASKQTERQHDIRADYCGFEFPDVWLAGMGMDDGGAGKEFYRWQDSIVEVL